MRRGRGLLIALAGALLVAAAAPRWPWPADRPAPPVPRDNPMSAAKVELGRRLFYDADLSIDGTMSCATCHGQRHAFADSTRTHPGVHGDPGRRNAPGLANLAWARSLTWGDPRVRTLEAQVLIPVLGAAPVEMGMKGSEAEIERRLSQDACYVRMFGAAFPERQGRIDIGTVADALAAFQRTLVSDQSPYDRGTLDETQRAGATAFAAHCASCHSGADLTDGRFHAIAPGGADRGLGEITGRRGDDGRFRTPSLRNVALTAPYLHDGSADTIDAAIARHRRVVLAAGERRAVLSFLDALTDRAFVSDRRYALPDSACGAPL